MATKNALELSRDQIEQYRDGGYLIVPDLLTEGDIDAFVAYEAAPKPEGWWKNLRHHAEDEQ